MRQASINGEPDLLVSGGVRQHIISKRAKGTKAEEESVSRVTVMEVGCMTGDWGPRCVAPLIGYPL